MGNRAVITTSTSSYVKDSTEIGVYVHWNGGRDSVEAFLEYCKLQGFPSPETDCYGYARLVQVIANYFGGGLSVGIEKCCALDCDNYDNGVYVIEKWKIVDRKYMHSTVEQQTYPLQAMLLNIDEQQPKHMQLGKEFLTAPIVPVEDIKIGDVVFIQDFSGRFEKCKVVGVGEDKFVNGTKVLGIPYVARYGNEGSYEQNPNNYLRQESYRVAKGDA